MSNNCHHAQSSLADQIWDGYVNSCSSATLYQLAAWRRIIAKTYGHSVYYLVARRNGSQTTVCSIDNLAGETSAENGSAIACQIEGILPLIHLKNSVFGNDLISIPFFDLGGILAKDEQAEAALLEAASGLAEKLKAGSIQLRQTTPLMSMPESATTCTATNCDSIHPNMGRNIQTHFNKARMLLDLPNSAAELMSSFKSKLRSQIKKPLKEGLTAKYGGSELLDDFYEVFCINMRDLGSPVHSKSFIRAVLNEFSTQSRICIVYAHGRPLAGGIVIGFRNTLHNPWASSLREYSKLSPNMLLYWSMLEFACDNGFSRFDFGRSSINESTYKFKQQWGARPQALHWHYIACNGAPLHDGTSDKSSFKMAIRIWQNLPVSLTKLIGPPVRKYIGL